MTTNSTDTNLEDHLTLDIPSVVMVSDLADMMGVNAVEVVKGLMRGGYMFAVNDMIAVSYTHLTLPPNREV